MYECVLPPPSTSGISKELLESSIARFVELAKEDAARRPLRDEGGGGVDGSGRKQKKVLLLPPDFTRFHSRAGDISNIIYDLMPPGASEGYAVTDVMPALGTHREMTLEEQQEMFSKDMVEAGVLRVHDWRNDVKTIGHCPSEMVRKATNGNVDEPWPVQLNKLVSDGGHDLIFSIGQVVPHEVMGMANFNKNLFVGVGGVEAINLSHFIGAVYGMEKVRGRGG